jgi:hypothetical protein
MILSSLLGSGFESAILQIHYTEVYRTIFIIIYLNVIISRRIFHKYNANHGVVVKTAEQKKL